MFRPDRFRRREGSAFDFITQGGDDHHREHRCAGEWVKIELVKGPVRLLAESVRYEVPEE